MNKAIFLIILLQLVIVSWRDIRDGKIRNYWALVNLVLGVIFYVAFSDLYDLGWQVLIAPVLTLVGGFVLFNLNIMGAGDSKYLASLFLVLPVDTHLEFFQRLVVFTLAVGALLLGKKLVSEFRELRGHLMTLHWGGLVAAIRSRFSYAPVMLLAWIALGFSRWV
jgi:prepilin peptidase CpaA